MQYLQFDHCQTLCAEHSSQYQHLQKLGWKRRMVDDIRTAQFKAMVIQAATGTAPSISCSLLMLWLCIQICILTLFHCEKCNEPKCRVLDHVAACKSRFFLLRRKCFSVSRFLQSDGSVARFILLILLPFLLYLWHS